MRLLTCLYSSLAQWVQTTQMWGWQTAECQKGAATRDAANRLRMAARGGTAGFLNKYCCPFAWSTCLFEGCPDIIIIMLQLGLRFSHILMTVVCIQLVIFCMCTCSGSPYNVMHSSSIWQVQWVYFLFSYAM